MLPKEKCEIDTFQAGFCDISFGLITSTTKKKTPAVKFSELIFRNNFFVFNFSKMCSR